MSDATTDPKARLSHDEILDAGLDDWRKVLNRLRARFRTGDFATGRRPRRPHRGRRRRGRPPPRRLADLPRGHRHAQQPRRRRHHQPRHRPRATDQRLRGRARRDARHVRAHRSSSPALDTAAPERLGAFYAALLGGEVENGEPVDPSGQVPGLWFQEGRARASPSLPAAGSRAALALRRVGAPRRGRAAAGGRSRRRRPAGQRRRGAVVLGGRGRRRQPLLHLHAARPRVTRPHLS